MVDDLHKAIVWEMCYERKLFCFFAVDSLIAVEINLKALTCPLSC